MALTVSTMTGGSNSHETTSEEANGVATDFVAQGIIGTYTNTSGVAPSTGAFAVNAQGTPDMTVAVSAGVAYVTGTPTGQNSQKFRVYNSASSNVTISANASGSTKYDWVYVKLDATLLNNPTLVGDTTATLVTSRSTSASTDDGTPPTYGYCIAVVTVANGASSITNSVIRDVRINATIGAVTSASTSWISGVLPAVSSVTYNGNRSYTVVFASTVAPYLSRQSRVKSSRLVNAPTQCTSLNGTTQYYSKASPNKLTFTDDFVVSAWIKLSSYATGIIASRYNGTSGFSVAVTASGQVQITGYNGGAANYSLGLSYQSLPLNKWVHVAAQLDMSTFTATSTTSYVMIDGVDVPIQVLRAGTNPTALIQAGDLQIGAANGVGFFPGKIAQVAVFNAKVTQATMRGYISQGLSGSETSLASAYSFSNSITDLNTTTPNDLTANGSAVATNADSPFAQDDSGTPTGSTDVWLIQSVSTTTVVAQVPEGCTIPTSGGISATSYSTAQVPFGWVADKGRWKLSSRLRTNSVTTSNATYGAYQSGGYALTVPVGAWEVGHQHGALVNPTTTAVTFNISPTALTGLTVNTGFDASPFAIKITSPAAAETNNAATLSDQVSQSTAQTWVMYTIGATAAASIQGAQATSEIYAIPAGI